MNNIMLDLETLGNKPGAVIVAIGAVRFGGGALGEEFYARIDAQSGVDCGLTLDAGTVLWWMKQGPEARAELLQPGEDLGQMLDAFIDFCAPSRDTLVWGNGSDFDNVLLAAAYEKVGMAVPWKFYNNRCYRTLKGLRPEVKLEIAPEARHNALADAQAQARHAMEIMAVLGITN